MGEIAVSNRVILRDDFGRFIEAVSDAARKTIEAAVKEGAQLSRDLAPVGHKDDPRTIPLKESIEWEVLSRTSGQWTATARHALPQEFGAGPHLITGKLSFFWEKEGRRWIPAAEFYHQPGLEDVINHPGNPAHPYLRPAYTIISGKLTSIMKRYYPG